MDPYAQSLESLRQRMLRLWSADYREIHSRLDAHVPNVGEQAVEELRLLGHQLKGRVVRHISSRAVGGGARKSCTAWSPISGNWPGRALDVIKETAIFPR